MLPNRISISDEDDFLDQSDSHSDNSSTSEDYASSSEEEKYASISGNDSKSIYIDDTNFDKNIGTNFTLYKSTQHNKFAKHHHESKVAESLDLSDIEPDENFYSSGPSAEDTSSDDDNRHYDKPSRKLHNGIHIAALDEDNEEIPANEITTELHKNVKSRLDYFSLDLECVYTLAFFLLSINAERRWPVILETVNLAISQITYLKCILPSMLIELLGLDAATVTAEAFGLTTGLAGVLSAFAIFALAYNIIQYYYTRQERNAVIQLTEFKTFKQRLDFKMLSLNKDQLNHLQENGFNKASFNSIKTPDSLWGTLTNEISWYNKEISKYVFPVALISLVGGLIKMGIEVEKLQSITGCDFSALITDNCPVLGRYDLATTLIYPWLSISAGTMFFYEMMINGKLIAFSIPKARKAGEWIYEHIHKPYEKFFLLRTEDENKWRYPQLAWNSFFTPALALILTYSLSKAFETADGYEDTIGAGSGCEHFTSFIGLIFSSQRSKNPACTTAQMIISVSGFLSVELSKIWPQFLTAKALSYAIGGIYGRYSPNKIKLSPERVDSLNKKFLEIHEISKVVAITSCLLTGLPLVYFARIKANEVLQDGLNVVEVFDVGSMINNYFNITGNPNINVTQILESHPFETFLHQICPYSDLKPLINQTLLDFPNLLNTTYPVKALDNSTVSYLFAKECPQYDIFSIFIRSLLGLVIDCNPIVYTRSIIIFASIYYLCISTLTGSPYLATTASLALIWAAKSIYKNCKKTSLDNDIELSFSRNKTNAGTVALLPNRNRLFSSSFIQHYSIDPATPKVNKKKNKVSHSQVTPESISFR